MNVESQVLQVLQGEATYEINGDGMTLTSDGGGLVLDRPGVAARRPPAAQASGG